MFRQTLQAAFSLTIATGLAWSAPSFAESRGLNVDFRTEAKAGAPIAGSLISWRFSKISLSSLSKVLLIVSRAFNAFQTLGSASVEVRSLAPLRIFLSTTNAWPQSASR